MQQNELNAKLVPVWNNTNSGFIQNNEKITLGTSFHSYLNVQNLIRICLIHGCKKG